MNFNWLVLTLAALVILGLAVYAGRLLWLLHQQTKQQNQQQQAFAEQRQQRLINKNKKLWQSIDTICRATQQGQCCSSEAAIRLCVLLDHLEFVGSKPDLATELPGLHGLYAAIKHHPTHDARKSYSKQDIRKLDKQREQFEQDYQSQLQQDLNHLLSQPFHLIA